MNPFCSRSVSNRSLAARLAVVFVLSIAVIGCHSLASDGIGSPDVIEPTMRESTMSDSHEPADAARTGQLEHVQDPVYDGTHVATGVVSNGCTSSDSFRIDHDVQAGVCLVTVVRQQEDLCRRMPRIVPVRIAWEMPADCDGLRVEFANPDIEAMPSLPGSRMPDQ